VLKEKTIKSFLVVVYICSQVVGGESF